MILIGYLLHLLLFATFIVLLSSNDSTINYCLIGFALGGSLFDFMLISDI